MARQYIDGKDVILFIKRINRLSAAPGTPVLVPATTGGTLAAATYFYKITAIKGGVESAGSVEASATTTGATSSIALSWAAPAGGADSYKIYRGTASNGQSVFFTSATASFTDVGAAGTAGTVPANETTFRGVACLETNNFSGSKEKKVVNNKCTAGWEDGLAGNGNWQMSGSGQAITDVLAAEANYQELAEIWAKGEIIEVKMANAAGTFYRAGQALITDWSDEANTDDPLSFDMTLSGLGAPVMVKP